MRATCPDCGAQAHVTAFFVEDDGKRLAMTVADMSPELGRATLAYLGLFKPVKTALRIARAAKLAQELADLVAMGTVCRDERNGMRRSASSAVWAAGIEQMLSQRASLTLPLDGHNYLRAVVYGLADKADAVAERKREDDAREGRHHRSTGSGISPPQPREDPLTNELRYLGQLLSFQHIDQAEHDRLADEARSKYGVSS